MIQKQEQTMDERIYEAFKTVRLEDGIGYWEANAIDDHLKPKSPSYLEAKAKDERNDWRIVAEMIDEQEGIYNLAAPCFMDAKGLLFFLPTMMLTLFDEVELLFGFLLEEVPRMDCKERKKMLSMLTKEQQQCLLDYFEMEIDYNGWLNFYLEESYTLEEAKGYIENRENYKIWVVLQRFFM